MLELLVTSLRYNDRCTHGKVIKLHMSSSSPFSVVANIKDTSDAAYLSLWSHCPMLIIGQNVEIWVEQSPFGVLTLCTTFITHCLHPLSCPRQLVLENLLLDLDEEEVLVQWIESWKRFQARSEVLHRPHLNPWTCAFWPSELTRLLSCSSFLLLLFLWTLSP